MLQNLAAIVPVIGAISKVLPGIADLSVSYSGDLSEAQRQVIVRRIDEATLWVLLISLGCSREDEVLARMDEERNPYLSPLLEAVRREMSNISAHGQ